MVTLHNAAIRIEGQIALRATTPARFHTTGLQDSADAVEHPIYFRFWKNYRTATCRRAAGVVVRPGCAAGNSPLLVLENAYLVGNGELEEMIEQSNTSFAVFPRIIRSKPVAIARGWSFSDTAVARRRSFRPIDMVVRLA